MKPKRRIIPVFVPHLGCPHDCVFCDQRGISGAQESPDGAAVHRIISEALKKLPHGEAVEAAFYGGSFTAVSKQLQNELLIAANRAFSGLPGASIRISTRPDYIDEETVERLRGFGVRTIELGAQSMCGDVLKLSARGHTPEDTRNASRVIKRAGVSLILQMMTGLLGDTPEKSIYTAREIAALHPDGVRIYPTVIIKNTRLHELWLAGDYREHTIEDAIALCAHLCDVFEDAQIPIIRLGLNPSDGLSAGAAVAGAYHPAFGELVSSARYLKSARNSLEAAGAKPGDAVTLTVARGGSSAMAGQRRCNIKALEREFSLFGIKVREDECVTGKNIVTNVEKQRQI